MVERRHDLARPAVRLLAELGNQLADPGLELAEPFGAVIGLARLVVLAARDQVVALARAGMEADVVVGIGHVPVERIRQRVAGDAERHGVGAVGRHLAVQLDELVDRRVGGDDGMARCDAGAVLGVHLDALRRGLDADHRAVGEQPAAFVHDRAGHCLQVFQGMEGRLARIAQRRCGLETDERHALGVFDGGASLPCCLELLVELLLRLLPLHVFRRKEKAVEPPEGAVDVELGHDRLDAVDGRLLALLEQPGHLLAAQVDQAADGIVADRRQVRRRARGHAAGDRAAVDDDHLLPGGREFVGR
jgi:hypothetical protein